MKVLVKGKDGTISTLQDVETALTGFDFEWINVDSGELVITKKGGSFIVESVYLGITQYKRTVSSVMFYVTRHFALKEKSNVRRKNT